MTIIVCSDLALGNYHFGPGHPFGPYRLQAFLNAFRRQGLAHRVGRYPARQASHEELLRFHTPDYVARVRTAEAEGLAFLCAAHPEFVLLQCGADSLAGDPITHLAFSHRVHARVTRDLCRLADDFCAGRLLAMGGGGYHPDNIGAAWSAVVAALLEETDPPPETSGL